MIGKILKGSGFLLVMAGLFLLLVYGFEILWNITVPEIFGLKSLTYGAALRLLILARILVGGFGFRWGNPAERGKFWRERMKMKMEHMSTEEKEEFKRRLWQKCKKDW
jgi:hypothetical protein